MISAAKQMDLPTHWIAEQGHHRGKRTQGDRYSRDDTVYQLLLQKTVVCKTKRGWKPITPQARGGQHPLPHKHFIIPTGDLKWPAFLEVALNSSLYNLSEDTTEQPHDSTPLLSLQDGNSSSKATVSKVSASDSDSESESSSSSSSEDEQQKNWSGPFILNHFTKTAHVAKTKDGKLAPGCGANFFDESLYRISDEIPEDF